MNERVKNRCVGCLSLAVMLCALRPGCAAAEEMNLQATDGKLAMAVSTLFSDMPGKSQVVPVGTTLRYRATVQNVSAATLRVAGEEEDAFEACIVRLTGDGKGTLTIRMGPAAKVTAIEPGQRLEFQGTLTALYPGRHWAHFDFRNRIETWQKPVMRTYPARDGEDKSMKYAGVVYESTPIEGVWVGVLSKSLDLTVEDRLSPRLDAIYTAAAQRVLACEKSGPHIGYGDAMIGGRTVLGIWDGNSTQQGEVFRLIRSIAQDGNKCSVAWLWDCFENTGRDSPAHLACMAELYGLLTEGIGTEQASKFLQVAAAPEDKQNTTARLYAIDAVSLLVEKEHLFCRSRGNEFAWTVDERTKNDARRTLAELMKDPNPQVRTRASRLMKGGDEHKGDKP